MKKETYVSPQTCYTEVELESGICAGSVTVQHPEVENGQIEEHEINKDFEFTFDNSNEWDKL